MWDRFGDYDFEGHPVRITGQMSFDASHSPCGHPKFRAQDDPKRRSLWEIHPVYKIDVCKNKALAGCPVDKEAARQSLEAWVAAQKAHP